MELTNYNKDKKLRKKPLVELGSMMYGKVPPQAKELEEAVLGAIMLEKSAFDNVIEFLKPQSFYVDANQRIFRAMIALVDKKMPIDLMTVVEQLKFSEELDAVGGPYYVTKLTNSVVSAANIETHARLITQKFLQREIIRIGGEMIGEAYEDSTDVFELLDKIDENLTEIISGNTKTNYVSISGGLVKSMQRLEELRTKGSDITGVTTGFPSIDRVTHGWQDTDLIVLAARPAVGKTALALNYARHAAYYFLQEKQNKSVGFFSLEMSTRQLIDRMLSAESEIWLEKISTGKMEEHEMKMLYKNGVEKLSQLPIFIDDSPGLNIYELRAKCRRLKNKNNVGLIIIDYLQLMNGAGDNRNGNREQEVSKISRELKGLAKELEVPIIALSQLSRETEKRSGDKKIPQLSDLRESGAIEQDADMVMFLYRPEYYDITANEMGESSKGETHVKIAKHRNGSLETIKLTALLHIQKFIEMEGGNFSPDGGRTWEPTSAKLFIQKGARLNDFDDDQPF